MAAEDNKAPEKKNPALPLSLAVVVLIAIGVYIFFIYSKGGFEPPPPEIVHRFAPGQQIKTWLVCGPFPNWGAQNSSHKSCEGYDKDYLLDYGGEWGIRPTPGLSHPSDSIKDGDAVWEIMQAKEDGHMDFYTHFNPNQLEVAYAVCYVEVDNDIQARMVAGSDDGIKIYINDEQVWRNHQPRGAYKNADRRMVQLRKGLNKVLVKVCNGGGYWGFYFRFDQGI